MTAHQDKAIHLHIAAYKFVALSELPTLRTVLKARAQENDLLGTILLSPEGINVMLAGTPEKINAFQRFLKSDPRFSDLNYKESYTEKKTYGKLLVKIKKEIIAFDMPNIHPDSQPAPSISPEQLKQLLDNHAEIVLLDARNDYEIAAGTFDNALDLNIQHFKQFPKALEKLDPKLKEKTIVTFCTGGIRCEKSAIYMQHRGYQQVYQLEGGILNYFKVTGGAYYHGNCYVFDERTAISPDSLKE